MDFRPVTELIDFSAFLPRDLRPWSIYALSDPRTGEVRYIGATHRWARLSEHLYSAKRCRTHKACWINGLVRLGLRPEMTVVEQGLGDSWAARERYWIDRYRRLGAPLTNHTLGGEGTLGWSPDDQWREAVGTRTKKVHTGRKRSPETRKRMSEAQLRRSATLRADGVVIKQAPRSPATLERMSKAQMGKKASAETRLRLSASARLRATPARKEQWAEAVRNRPQPWKTWFAQNQRGIPKTAEHKAKISASLRKRRSKPSS